MDKSRSIRKPSVWRPIQARTFLVPDGSNVITASRLDDVYNSSVTPLKLIESHQIKKGGMSYSVAGTPLGALRALWMSLTHATSIGNILKQLFKLALYITGLLALIFGVFCIYSIIEANQDQIRSTAYYYYYQGKQSVNKESIKNNVTTYSLEFFRMNK